MFKSGYIGSQMSVRAMEAYDAGYKPISRWTKQDVLAAPELSELVKNYDLGKIKKSVLLEFFLERKEWHHTGSYFSETGFYGIDEERVENFSEADFAEMARLSDRKAEPAAECHEIKFVKVSYKEWSGTRKHPKSRDVTTFGRIDGDWFLGLRGQKKKVSGNWFSVVEEYDSEASMLSAAEASKA